MLELFLIVIEKMHDGLSKFEKLPISEVTNAVHSDSPRSKLTGSKICPSIVNPLPSYLCLEVCTIEILCNPAFAELLLKVFR